MLFDIFLADVAFDQLETSEWMDCHSIKVDQKTPNSLSSQPMWYFDLLCPETNFTSYC